MLIHEVARRVGISTDAVRYYEREGLIDERHVTRLPNRYRDYDDAAVERLSLVRQARSSGMSMVEVKTLAAAFDDGSLTPERQVAFLQAKLSDLDRQAEAVRAAQESITAKIAALKTRIQA